MKFSVLHYLLAACSVGTAVSEALAHAAVLGVSLPWHLSAGACLTAATIFGAVSKSINVPVATPAVSDKILPEVKQ